MNGFGHNGVDVKTTDPVVQQPMGLGAAGNRIQPMTPEQSALLMQMQQQQQSVSMSQFGTAPPMVNQFGMPLTQYPTAPPGGTTQFGMAPPQQPMMMTMTPPGLSYLATMDHIIIKQEIDLLEVVTGFDTNNRYKVMTPQGLVLFNAIEESDACDRACLGASRTFNININDLAGQPLMSVDRPYAGCCCAFNKMSVFSPPGVLAGTVEQESLWTPKFNILNAEGEAVFQIEGPACAGACSCGADVDFQVFSIATNAEIGKISKTWSGMMQEMYTNADTFGISFPVDLAISMKAVFLGACFLIDFMYFEQSNNGRHRGTHRRY